MEKLTRMLCTVLTAGLMAGCTACFAARALGFDVSWVCAYPAAIAVAAVLALTRRRAGFTLAAAAAIAVALGAVLAANMSGLRSAIGEFAAAGTADETFFAKYASAASGGTLALAILLGAIMALLLRSPGGVPMALTLEVAAVLCGLSLNENTSVWAALPGLAAGLAAFGLASQVHRADGVRPALLLPALVLVIVAMLVTPSARVTWEPLENLAERIRSVVDDYVRFTEQRVAFSIAEKGYDHAGLVNDHVTAMLGGPANPSDDTVMKVKTGTTLLLRGSVRRTYTGYSWIDDQAKARYLYYDFTHSATRDDAFDADIGTQGFDTVEVSVEMLSDGTSTLFVPAHMTSFDMDLSNAVYYNVAGEIFLTRETQAGDSYTFTASLPQSSAALIAAAQTAQDKQDAGYDEAVANYTALPEGIDSQVYALAVELTQDKTSPVEKAYAIQEYLAGNYKYTLETDYPDDRQDFVSRFLLEEKQGYCSYFASAMTVLCRIAGIPARYVEGYYVQAEADGETIVTGRNAHAWVEVYLNGIGWTAFDPTARAVEQSQGESDETAGEDDNGGTPDPDDDNGGVSHGEGTDGDEGSEDGGIADTSAGSDTPDGENNDDSAGDTPEDQNDNEDRNDDRSDDTPDDQSNDRSDDTPEDEPEDQPENQNDDRNLTWLWILLALLLLAALIVLLVLWLKKRIAASDPLKLAAATKDTTAACLLLYRAILTLLARYGLVPQGGETAQAFAERVAQTVPNGSYPAFASALATLRYSGNSADKETYALGKKAYKAFLNGMKKSERLRYELRRAVSGNGDMENIP